MMWKISSGSPFGSKTEPLIERCLRAEAAKRRPMPKGCVGGTDTQFLAQGDLCQRSIFLDIYCPRRVSILFAPDKEEQSGWLKGFSEETALGIS